MHAGNHMGIMTTFKKPTAERETPPGARRERGIRDMSCAQQGYRKIKRPFPPTPARGEPARPAPAAGQPCRQPAGHRPAPQGTDRTGDW